MRALAVVLCLLPGCVYHVDVPRDAMPDVTECGCTRPFSSTIPDYLCCPSDGPTDPEGRTRFLCTDPSDWQNCGGCGVVCGPGETCRNEFPVGPPHCVAL